MPPIICIHEYVLKPEVTAEQFEDTFRVAQESGLLQLPGLIDYHVWPKGSKGRGRATTRRFGFMRAVKPGRHCGGR
ncbi:hypothetical protein C2W62_18600 [Candidatus Entotheonella serta]|nr:hypothetical protein C2W62_18600 [Candidatus Entotheonella serta]